MGICKCRQRTNYWCFVHSKAVCTTSCIVEHKSCYVGLYMQWLTDAYYEKPKCALCKEELTEDTCIRLTCLDAFHIDCLNAYCAAFPPHTAIAGYTCPTCSKPIIPTNEPSTPLIESVKDFLRAAPWVEKLGGLEAIESAAAAGVTLTIAPSPGAISPIPVTDISSKRSKTTRSNPMDMTGDEEEEDKYAKRAPELFAGLDGKKKTDATGRIRRPLVSTRRILVLFALVSTLATAVILYLSLSVSDAE